MKATLATLACLLTVGFLSAASVEGNNTAVVIRKNVVSAKNGYQFLCVPVNGLNIAGAEDGEVALETLLPAATLPNGTFVTGMLENGDQFDYTVANSVWTSNGAVLTESPTFKGGQIFWLNTQAANRTRSAIPTTIVFCGQERDLTLGGAPTSDEVVAMCNDSSVAIKLSAVIETPKNLDQILTIKAGSSEYNIYRYLGGTWYGSGSESECNDVEIAPGEAFYYYTK